VNVDAWTTLARLLDAALDLPPDERTRWVADLPAEFDRLKPRMQRLLAHALSLENSDFLDGLPAVEIEDPGRTATPGVPESAGEIVGPYRLVREIAEGGMGAVWLAERADGLMANRPVALKRPRGPWQRAGLVERMAREREFLASLAHPHIARLYDAGVDAGGHPYLALEYIEGEPIDAYCRNHSLDLRARLSLFLQVASAVGYAHGKLIVHRDLKPTNILVTGDGEVKLLDFGIAKLLGGEESRQTALTEISGPPLTPDYASPEQIAGEPLGVASDVYSLGIVLYELLTGSRPYTLRRGSRAGLEEAIRQADPPRPSLVCGMPWRGALRGDLETILLKALKKDPDERYVTVNALADDLERWIEGRPVRARPDALSYRVRKFVARNTLAVGAAAAILLAVLGGAALAVWQARVALAEKQRAEEVKDFIAGIFQDADPYAGQGRTVSAADLLNKAKGEIDRIGSGRSELRVELLTLVGSSLVGLGDLESADTVARQAVDTAARELGPEDERTIQARLLLTDVFRYRGRLPEMRAELDRLAPVVRREADARPADLVRVLENQAHLAVDAAQYQEAQALAKEAFDRATATFGAHHPQTAAVATILAESHLYGKMPDEARMQVIAPAFRLVEETYADRPRHPRVIYMRDVLGRAFFTVGQIGRAVAEGEHALRDGIEVFGADNMTVAQFANNLAGLQRLTGALKASIEHSDLAIGIFDRLTEPESYYYAGTRLTRGVTLLAARRAEAARRDLADAGAVLSRIYGPSNWETLSAQLNEAVALAYLGRFAEADERLRPVYDGSPDIAHPMWARHIVGIVKRLQGDFAAALESQEAAFALIPDDPKADWNRERVWIEIGLDQVGLRRYAAALESFDRARSFYPSRPAEMHPDRADALVGAARAHIELGQPARALPLLEEADAFWRAFDPGNRYAGHAALWLGRAYARLGRNADAAPALSRAAAVLSRSSVPADAEAVAQTRVGTRHPARTP
jgi:serine/threonine-protein kinase